MLKISDRLLSWFTGSREAVIQRSPLGKAKQTRMAGHATLPGSQYSFLQHTQALQCTLLVVVITEQVQQRHAVTCP